MVSSLLIDHKELLMTKIPFIRTEAINVYERCAQAENLGNICT